MYTYIATNTLNGKFYIGSSINFKERKKGHLTSKKKYPFQNALRKNPEAFEWEVWQDDSGGRELEQALLDMWFGKEQCYNLNPKASEPPILMGERNPNFGKTDSPGFLALQTPSSAEKRTSSLRSEKSRKERSERVTGKQNPAYGRRWWVGPNGEAKYQQDSPGQGWRQENPYTGGQRNFFYGKSLEWSEERRLRHSERMLKNPTTKGWKWWVNSQGETQMSPESPGPDWQNGRKWGDG
jgi:group I intron endonuclease